MSLTEEQKSEIMSKTVATLTDNEPMRQEFMKLWDDPVKNAGSIKEYMVTKLNVPTELADELVSYKDPNKQAEFVGTLICNYLW